MAQNDTRKHEPQPKSPEPKGKEPKDAPRAVQKIDFAKLDLRVEKVEERISPSETNVFDK